MRTAIVGAGFCGLAAAWHLSQYRQRGLDIAITIFDPKEIGDNASGLSAGLLHPYPGAHAKPPKRHIEAMEATLELLEAASNALGKPVAKPSGLLRVAVTAEQKADFRLCAETHSDVRWCDPDACRDMFPGLAPHPGIFIPSARSVDTALYLEGLWAACHQMGATWKKTTIASLKQLEGYDAVVIASGAACTRLPELAHLPIRPVKGQLLEIAWPKGWPPLSFPLNSKAYMVMKGADTCVLGATFERRFKDSGPDPTYARDYLVPKLLDLFPDFGEVDVVACRAGLRASTPDHRPLCRRIDEKRWILTGMGSKGLLYHALLAKELAADIFRDLC